MPQVRDVCPPSYREPRLPRRRQNRRLPVSRDRVSVCAASQTRIEGEIVQTFLFAAFHHHFDCENLKKSGHQKGESSKERPVAAAAAPGRQQMFLLRRADGFVQLAQFCQPLLSVGRPNFSFNLSTKKTERRPLKTPSSRSNRWAGEIQIILPSDVVIQAEQAQRAIPRSRDPARAEKFLFAS